MRLELDLDFTRHFTPEGFFFGVANAPYLCEGGYNVPGGPANSYGVLEDAGTIERSGDAVSFWADPEPHIELAASLGLDAFRMGVDWSRIQPSSSLVRTEPPDWDDDAIAHYAQIIASVWSHGMQPIITLHHFTHPAWMGLDLWQREDGVDALVAFELRAVEEINDRLLAMDSRPISHFLVYNEPNLIPILYHGIGLFFPLPQGPEQLLVPYDNMVYGYIQAYDGLHDLFERRGWVTPHAGFTIASLAAYEFDRQMTDIVRLRTNGVAREDVSAAIAGHRSRWYERLDALARSQLTEAQYARYEGYKTQGSQAAPAVRMERTLDALYASPRETKLDYLSINVYDPLGEARHEPDELGKADWDQFRADGEIYRTLILASNDGNETGLPFYMGENSLANLQPIGEPARPRPDGWTRERYLKTYLMEMVRCIKEGVPIKGYLYWSLVDDFEWHAGFAPRLGLFNYDYESRRILPTDGFGEPSGAIYAHLVSALRSGDKLRIQDAFVDTYAHHLAQKSRTS